MNIKVKPEIKHCDQCKNDTDHFTFFSGEKLAKVSVCKQCGNEELVGKPEQIPNIK